MVQKKLTKPKRYKAILADPPWTYNDKCRAGKRGVEYKYSCLTLEELKRLNIQNISDDNSALFLWSTAPQIPTALEVMKAWGFDYKTVAFTWIKHYPKSGKLAWGMGNYTRANPEYVLLGTKGKPIRVDAGVHSVVNAPRLGHSEKPHAVNDRIVDLLGKVPRAELFARHPIDGWDVWGDEVKCDFEIELLPELLYLCPECNSEKVEEQFWIDINTEKPSKREGEGFFYCNYCKKTQPWLNLADAKTGQVVDNITKVKKDE